MSDGGLLTLVVLVSAYIIAAQRIKLQAQRIVNRRMANEYTTLFVKFGRFHATHQDCEGLTETDMDALLLLYSDVTASPPNESL